MVKFAYAGESNIESRRVVKDEGREVRAMSGDEEPVCLGSDLGSEREDVSEDEAWAAFEESSAVRAAWRVCSFSGRFLPRPR